MNPLANDFNSSLLRIITKYLTDQNNVIHGKSYVILYFCNGHKYFIWSVLPLSHSIEFMMRTNGRRFVIYYIFLCFCFCMKSVVLLIIAWPLSNLLPILIFNSLNHIYTWEQTYKCTYVQIVCLHTSTSYRHCQHCLVKVNLWNVYFPSGSGVHESWSSETNKHFYWILPRFTTTMKTHIPTIQSGIRTFVSAVASISG